MALLTSLFAGVSGLRNHQTMMDVIGNNISNVNTIGFKSSRVTFSDTFNTFMKAGTNPTDTTGGTNSQQVGLGTKVNSIDRNWNQGTFETTGITTDLALQGPGMFVVKSNGQKFYTRAGAFQFDATGKLVTSNGAIVQGKVALSDGTIPPGNNLQDLVVNTNLKLPATATTKVQWGGNLKSDSNVTRSENVTLRGNIQSSSLAVGESTPDLSTTIYNESGVAYTLTTNYAKTAADVYTLNWDVTDSAGTSITTGNIANLTFVDDGTGNFALNAASQALFDGINNRVQDTNNQLDFNILSTGVTENTTTSTLSSSADSGRTPNIVNGSVTIYDSLGTAHQATMKYTKIDDNAWRWSVSVPTSSTADGLGATKSGTVIFNPDGTLDPSNITPSIHRLTFEPKSGAQAIDIDIDMGSGFAGVTQTSASSSISSLAQDGSPAASLSNINIDQYGKVVGIFTNGSSKNLAQLMVATFNDLNGLISAGDNMYSAYANSGLPIIGELGEASNTTVQSGALEQSNVDLSTEFTKMIVSQRGFQANARVITTADTLLQEITNLIR